MRICSIEGCNRKHQAKGLCGMHYHRLQRHGDPLFVRNKGGICSIEGCNNKHEAKGYCALHYQRFRIYGDTSICKREKRDSICIVEGCNNKHRTEGYCDNHYYHWKRYGDPLVSQKEHHGCVQMLEYGIWGSMKQRCSNPNDRGYKWYGGRGIKVCEKWQKSFIVFLEDMGPKSFPKAEIDRIDNNGNYEPGNCRWTTHIINVRNSRTMKNNV